MVSAPARLSNPVLSIEFAEKLALGTDVYKFDLHTDLVDILAGTTPAFIAEAYDTARWWLDQSIKTQLKAAARLLPDMGDRTIDSFSEIQNALNEQWDSEEHSYEIGFEHTGPLHAIVAMRSVRAKWMEAVALANTARGYINPKGVMSIEVQLATPNKQKITSAQMANFEFDALKLVGGLSNVALRGEFRDGVNMSEQLASIERVKRDKNPLFTDEQIAMVCEQDDEFKAVQAKLSGLSATCIRALNHLGERIAAQEALFTKWYEAEIKNVERQLHVWSYCEHQVQDEQPAFHQLPGSLQVTVCNAVTDRLTQTLSRYSSKASHLYSTYSLIIDVANDLLQRVVAARLDGGVDVGANMSADDTDQREARIHKRNDAETPVHSSRGKMM